MLKKSVIIILNSILLLFLSCAGGSQIFFGSEYSKIYREKGYHKDKDMLVPRIYKLHQTLWAVGETDILNTAAVVNSNDEICSLKISNTGILSVKPVVAGFPGGYRIGTRRLHNERNIVWRVLNRALEYIDFKTLVRGEIPYALSETDSFAVDSRNNLFFCYDHSLIDGMRIDDYYTIEYYFLYDMKAKKIIFTSPKKRYNKKTGYRLDYYAFDGSLLIKKLYVNSKGHFIKNEWYITDLYSKKKWTNSFTEMLSKHNINDLLRLNKRKRMVFAFSRKEKLYYRYSWSKGFKKTTFTKISLGGDREPVKFQCISPDFKWIAVKYGSNLVFYYIESKLPYYIVNSWTRGIKSVYCGSFGSLSRGVFMNHEKWGPCFLYFDSFIPMSKYLYVFSLKKGKTLLEDNNMFKSRFFK